MRPAGPVLLDANLPAGLIQSRLLFKVLICCRGTVIFADGESYEHVYHIRKILYTVCDERLTIVSMIKKIPLKKKKTLFITYF